MSPDKFGDVGTSFKLAEAAASCTTKADADELIAHLGKIWRIDKQGAAEAIQGALHMIPDADERAKLSKLFPAAGPMARAEVPARNNEST